MRSWIGCIVLGAAVFAGAACCPEEPPDDSSTTVYLVRHAEKAADGSADPPLTEAGLERAEALARALADVELAAIYSTQFARTRDTGQAVATRQGLEVTMVPIEPGGIDDYMTSFPARVLDAHAGHAVLIVGHSNTVPRLIEALGIPSAPGLTEQDYDDLFRVTTGSAGEARLLHLHYGEASP